MIQTLWERRRRLLRWVLRGQISNQWVGTQCSCCFVALLFVAHRDSDWAFLKQIVNRYTYCFLQCCTNFRNWSQWDKNASIVHLTEKNMEEPCYAKTWEIHFTINHGSSTCRPAVYFSEPYQVLEKCYSKAKWKQWLAVAERLQFSKHQGFWSRSSVVANHTHLCTLFSWMQLIRSEDQLQS